MPRPPIGIADRVGHRRERRERRATPASDAMRHAQQAPTGAGSTPFTQLDEPGCWAARPLLNSARAARLHSEQRRVPTGSAAARARAWRPLAKIAIVARTPFEIPSQPGAHGHDAFDQFRRRPGTRQLEQREGIPRDSATIRPRTLGSVGPPLPNRKEPPRRRRRVRGARAGAKPAQSPRRLNRGLLATKRIGSANKRREPRMQSSALTRGQATAVPSMTHSTGRSSANAAMSCSSANPTR